MTTQRFLTMFLCCVSFFCCSKSAFGAQQTRQATTEAADPAMYAWEQDRNGILSFSDLVLRYGRRHAPDAYRWDEQPGLRRSSPIPTNRERNIGCSTVSFVSNSSWDIPMPTKSDTGATLRPGNPNGRS